MADAPTVDSASRARAFEALQPVDWFLVILELERNGYTHRSLAGVTMSSRGSIGNWRCGNNEPTYTSGECLIELWILVTGRPRDMLPRRRAGQQSAARVK